MLDKADVIKSFLRSVCSFSDTNNLLERGQRYIVALSGGADSVSLLCALKAMDGKLSIAVEAAHCNFHLRGEESDRDEHFCRQLCQRLGVPLHLVHFDTMAYSQLHHVSVEMAARNLRYAYFEQLRRDIGARCVCVAHHRDDSVETVLLNLVRGTGIRGLRGIQPRNGHIVRPLLCVSRTDILDYLNALGEAYVTDSTNLKNDVKRNKIRLDIMPMLEQLNPSVANTIFETSLRVGEALKVYDYAVDRMARQLVVPAYSHSRQVCNSGQDVPVMVDVGQLLDLPSPESVLHHILSGRGFSSSQIERLYGSLAQGGADGCGQLSTGSVLASASHELLYNRGQLIVQPIGYGVVNGCMRIPEPGAYVLSDCLRIRVVEESIGAGYGVSRESMCVCVDASAAKFPLTVRRCAEGERFVPFGMSRSKLVSDFLTDRKLTVFDKRRQLVVADATGRIVWLVGERIDNRCRIGKHSTTALRISAEFVSEI